MTNNVGASMSQVIVVKSEDDWATASQSASASLENIVATTLALRDESIYEVFGRFEVLFNPAATTPAPDAEIRLVNAR